MQSNKIEQYKDAISTLLMDFQWIEQILKIVISSSYEIISRSCPPEIAFRIDGSSLKKDTLGKLVIKYAELTNNIELAKELKTLIEHRNTCAHKAFFLSLEEQFDDAFLSAELHKYFELHDRAKKCVLQLTTELENLSKLLNENKNTTVERNASLMN